MVARDGDMVGRDGNKVGETAPHCTYSTLGTAVDHRRYPDDFGTYL
jgi:hypothetical protein